MSVPAPCLEPDLADGAPSPDPSPGRDDLAETGRRVTRRTQLRRRRAARRRLVTLVALFALCAAGLAAFLLVTRTQDPYSGVWWEPSSGRRVELVASGDGYKLLYGAAKREFTARRDGARLVVPTPLGGQIVIRPRDDGTLVMKEAGQATVLSRLPGGL